MLIVFVVLAIVLALLLTEALIVGLAPESGPGKELKGFFSWLADFFHDKAGGSDDKRALGIIFLAAVLIYVFTRPAGPDIWPIAGGMAAVGTGLLIGAGAQDGIQPKPPGS